MPPRDHVKCQFSLDKRRDIPEPVGKHPYRRVLCAGAPQRGLLLAGIAIVSVVEFIK